MIKRAIEIFSLYSLSSSLVFGLALETARVTFQDPNPGGANFPLAAAAPLGVLNRVNINNAGNLDIPYVSDAAVDIFTRYVSTLALGPLANLGGLVDVNNGAGPGNNTIDPLIDRLRRFYATDLAGFQTAVAAFALIPNHLCLAAVTIVSDMGGNGTAICPNGECFQFSTYFLDHLFVSGDAVHNAAAVPVPVPPYLPTQQQADNFIFNFFGQNFPPVAFLPPPPPPMILPGSYGDPTGPSVACDTAGVPAAPPVPAIPFGSIFAFPHSPIAPPPPPPQNGATSLTPLDPNVVAAYNAAIPGAGFIGGAPFQIPAGLGINDLWFSGWWYSSGQIFALLRHSERALGVFLESIYSNGLVGLPAPGGGVPLPPAPALPVAYSTIPGNTLAAANHPNIQPDAVEIYNAIQAIPNVVAVIIHIRNVLRMCSTCAGQWSLFAQTYPVIAGNIATPLGDMLGNQVRFVFMVGSGNGGAIEIYQ
jgi:hypothetical protein